MQNILTQKTVALASFELHSIKKNTKLEPKIALFAIQKTEKLLKIQIFCIQISILFIFSGTLLMHIPYLIGYKLQFQSNDKEWLKMR